MLHSLMPNIPWAKIMGTEKTTTAYKPSDITTNEVLMILRNCATEYSHTPDADKLELNRYTPMFLYCSMMRGGRQYPIIENICRMKDDDGLSASPYAFTEERYEAWQTRDGKDSIPIALTSRAQKLSPFSGSLKHQRRRGRIKGRLYWVRSDMIKELDKVRQNGVLFRRREVNILIPYREQIGCLQSEEQVHTVRAWMYLGRHSHWDPLLDGGYNFEKCKVRDYTSRVAVLSKHKSIPYFVPPKKWMNEPFYFFNAWSIANQ